MYAAKNYFVDGRTPFHYRYDDELPLRVHEEHCVTVGVDFLTLQVLLEVFVA
jgi:hypothetical protein